jgi:hypothetical protein
MLQVLPKPLKKRESARALSAPNTSAADTKSDGASRYCLHCTLRPVCKQCHDS